MKHHTKAKALGLALAAMLAIGAMSASSASAEFTAEEVPAILTGEDIEQSVFEFTGIELSCNVSKYEAEMGETHRSTITVTPTYTECVGGGLNIDVTGFTHNDPEESKCHFVLDTGGTVDLECAPGGEVTVVSTPSVCVVHIPPQERLTEVTYSEGTREGKRDLELAFSIVGIKATHTDGFLCPMTGSGESKEDRLTGTVTMWAEDAAEELVDLTHHEADPEP